MFCRVHNLKMDPLSISWSVVYILMNLASEYMPSLSKIADMDTNELFFVPLQAN